MNILLKYHIRKEDEKYSLDEKCWTIYPPPKLPSPIYPKIAKSDLPSNCLYDLPPPLKSSSPIWSYGTLYLTSSVKGILGKISISESAFEERGRFFQFHHITFDYLLSTTV